MPNEEETAIATTASIADLSTVAVNAHGLVVQGSAETSIGRSVVATHDMAHLTALLDEIQPDIVAQQVDWQETVSELMHSVDCWLEGLRMQGRVQIDRLSQVVHIHKESFEVEKRTYRFGDRALTLATLKADDHTAFLYSGRTWPPDTVHEVFMHVGGEDWKCKEKGVRLNASIFEQILVQALQTPTP